MDETPLMAGGGRALRRRGAGEAILDVGRDRLYLLTMGRLMRWVWLISCILVPATAAAEDGSDEVAVEAGDLEDDAVPAPAAAEPPAEEDSGEVPAEPAPERTAPDGTEDPAAEAPAPEEAPVVEEAPPTSEPVVGVRATAELGFLAVLSHDIRLGSDGTEIDYPSDGAQSNLFFFARLSLEFDIRRRHYITFLYQPLELDSTATLRRDLRIDGLDYPAGTPVRFFYGFPFFRLSWDYDLLPEPDQLLALGLGLQLRNANISFTSLDGTLFRGRNDVGPVPLLRARGRFPVVDRFFFGFEVDGFYAPISVLNGSDTEVTGAILDASVRFGWRFLDHADVFLNVRYLAGGAVGQGDPTPTSDGQQSNWLHFLTLSIGSTLDSRP